MTTDNTITTTVTFDDFSTAIETELANLREAYEDLREHATEKYGDNEHEWPQETRQELNAYNEGAKQLQQRKHVLEELANRYSSREFELKMLTGQEILDIETTLRMDASREGVDPEALQAERKGLVADEAVVDAPDEVPTGDDGPRPSECPNPLTFAVYEQAEKLNQAGDTGFTPPGFEDAPDLAESAVSDHPTDSNPE